ncbi:hypothetical protein [Methylomicrobium agile]|uniref:hypothetical protein n=1 Tax=Methylomicrobium agile TaxID=39774 RepID=UPI0012F6C017|nr:hypothetical protein [Methylomicrobium agile]
MSALTPPQRRVLDNLARGKPAESGIRGRSAHGGLTWTISALYRKGLIDDEGITDKGRQAIKFEQDKWKVDS